MQNFKLWLAFVIIFDIYQPPTFDLKTEKELEGFF